MNIIKTTILLKYTKKIYKYNYNLREKFKQQILVKNK